MVPRAGGGCYRRDCRAQCRLSRRPITVEINTKAYADHNGRIFPSPGLWGKLRRAGIPLIVNSDAHVPALINASRFIAMEMLEQEPEGVAEPVGTTEPVGNLTGE